MMKIVEKIESNSEEISKISILIDEIAQQTNMLSLNASIEAARAGEQGRAFRLLLLRLENLLRDQEVQSKIYQVNRGC